MRRPQHTFQVSHTPFEIQPFMIAPVLPGETMKNLLVQSRAVTDPILNALIGWWQEYYFFYVKHRDLAGRDDYTEMMLDTSKSMAAYLAGATDQYMYNRSGAIDWMTPCYRRIVEEYFRDEGEAWNVVVDSVSGLALAKINSQSWYDTMVDTAVVPTTTIESDTSDLVLRDLDRAQQTFEYMRNMGLTNMSYEDFLATYGVRPSSVELHRPELIRYIREWTYPSNTVNPSTGVPSSACSWSIAERADKDRFFKEPGFIVGLTCTRPKVYYHQQRGSGVQLLDNAFSWLPAVMADDPATSLKLVDNAVGPVEGVTNDYWVDVRDLFLYGDQFHNRPDAAVNGNFVELPDAALNYKYPPGNRSTRCDQFFVSQDETAVFTRQDGVVSLMIAGTQQDHTPHFSGGM